MTPLDDHDTRSLRAEVRKNFDIWPGYGAFFTPDFLRRRGFLSIVFGGDFRDAHEGVSSLCRENSIRLAYCLDVDDATTLPAFTFVPTHEHLKAVRTRYHTPSYAIGDETNSFMIVSDRTIIGALLRRQISSRR